MRSFVFSGVVPEGFVLDAFCPRVGFVPEGFRPRGGFPAPWSFGRLVELLAVASHYTCGRVFDVRAFVESFDDSAF